VSKYRVMVVDDDADVRFVVTSLLSLDFETVQATNGLDALEKFERYEPDLLLLDVTMPIMNGFQCCRAVRKREDYTDLPVFFLSAMSDPKVLAEAKESGATDYVEKPFDTKALIDRIREHLYGQRIPPRMKLFTMREIEKIDATPLTAASRDESEEETLNPAQNASSTGVPALSLAPPPEPGAEGKPRRRVFGMVRPETTPLTQTGASSETVNLPRGFERPTAPPPAAPPAPVPQTEDPFSMPPPPPPAESPYPARRPDGRPVPIPPTEDPFSFPTPASDVYAPNPIPMMATPSNFRPTQNPVAPNTPATIPPPGIPPQPPSPVVLPKSYPPGLPQAPQAAQPPAAPPPPPAARPQAMAPVPPTAPPPSAAPQKTSRYSEEQLAEAREIMAARRRQALGLSPAAAKSGKSGGTAALPRVLVMIDHVDLLPAAHEGLRGVAEFLPLEDPVEALEVIVRFQPDIVVASIKTPVYSGLDLGRMLQENVRLSRTQLIFLMHPKVTAPEAQAARRMSGNDLLNLGCKAGDLRQAIQRVTQKPGFEVRQKGLSYSVYVNEIIKAANAERSKVNKELEKEAFRRKTMGIETFMARELSQYQQPPRET
jgi:CheY-like chemotaxis protein